jgi:hypothetical protein
VASEAAVHGRSLSMGAERQLPPWPRDRATVSDGRNISQIGCADGPGRSAPEGITRSELFATLYLLGILNGHVAVFFFAIQREHMWQALAGSINLVIVSATVVGLYLLSQSTGAAIARWDWVVATVIALLLLVPSHTAAWVAVTSLALYAMGRDWRSSTAVASATVFLAIAASSFWGPELIQAFGPTLLASDAALAVAWLDVLGHGAVERIGNVIVASDQTRLVVVSGCASLPNLLYGLLCWTAVARLMRPAWRPEDLLALLAVAGLVVAANTLRLGLMGLSADIYEWVHSPVGDNIFNVSLLLLIALIALHSTAPAPSSLCRVRGSSSGGEPW